MDLDELEVTLMTGSRCAQNDMVRLVDGIYGQLNSDSSSCRVFVRTETIAFTLLSLGVSLCLFCLSIVRN